MTAAAQMVDLKPLPDRGQGSRSDGTTAAQHKSMVEKARKISDKKKAFLSVGNRYRQDEYKGQRKRSAP